MPRQSTSFKIAGTDTFRRAATQILKHRNKEAFGDNLQNKNKEISKFYIPDDGYEMFQCDQAGAEALIVAYLCESARYRELFTNGIKVHVYVAIHFFPEVWKSHGFDDIKLYQDAPISQLKSLPRWKELDSLIKSTDKWEASKRYYYMAKRVCHSSNYGIQAPELAINILKDSEGQIKLSVEQVSRLLALYHGIFPEIRRWNMSVQKQLEMTHTLRNLFDFPRKYYGPITADLLKKAYAWIPQSTVGIITAKAIVAMQDWIEQNNKPWDILNDKHDSFLVQVPIGDDPSSQMQAVMEQDLKSPRGEIFKMRSEVQRGFSWGTLH